MPLRHGRELLMIPGPTTIPDAVLQAMHRPAVEIYTGELVALTDRCLVDIKRLFGTAGNAYIYAANGHGAWEAALSNTLSGGDKVLVLESGRFATGWGETALSMGLEVEVLPQAFSRAVDPAAVRARLAADDAEEIAAILVVQIDTASGVMNDIPAIRAAIDAAGHPALLMVDTVASLGIVPFEMDAWGVDVAMCGAQKGLMTPPGLGLVAAGPKAIAAHADADLVTRYWDWTFRDGPEHYMKYCGTPPEHLLFAFRKALDILLTEEGLEAAHRRHALLAEATRRAVAVWAEAGALSFNIEAPSARANSVTVVRTTDPAVARRLVDTCRDRYGVVLSNAIGQLEGGGFRIGHMGHVNAAALLGTLAVIETALASLGVPHGAGGTAAAIAWLADATRD
ncbi:pyridoxal-phosphate-dependent aminotransferase family protein [Methylobrevis albus]|uniref:Aminotransferase class V-fold PLP-dependent enzyme n=1 Tax=Methylobrevis albus TaxID=2793297 RepID=A0A931I2Y1_9HYPH|nr:aminotransferase class V-fold PLP-dependent enzyme [Methylobrevis albus]MBH0239265.1 aminotransferase class V-fold PLP-dependent enzyme [Methylobrevis albus]